MGLVGFNLVNLFLNSEGCNSLEAFSLKSFRQRKPAEPNPDLIVYAKNTFAVIRLHKLLAIMLERSGEARTNLARLFRRLDLSPAPG